jgi:hypothetical protein
VIATREGKLFATPSRGPAHELLPESETEYFIREDRNVSVTFRQNAGGGPVRLFVTQRGQTTKAKKLSN